MMIYALARSLEPADRPAIRAIACQTAQNGYRISSVVLGIVNSVPYQQRKARSHQPMIVTRKQHPRRTCLRGMGTALALPAHDSMTPALDGPTAKAPPRLLLHSPRANMISWTPRGEGRSVLTHPETAGSVPRRLL